MKAAIGCLIVLVFGISASAEPLLEGRPSKPSLGDSSNRGLRADLGDDFDHTGILDSFYGILARGKG